MFIPDLLSRSRAIGEQRLERNEKAVPGCCSQIPQSDTPGDNFPLLTYRKFSFLYFQIRWQQGVRTKLPLLIQYECGALTQTFKSILWMTTGSGLDQTVVLGRT